MVPISDAADGDGGASDTGIPDVPPGDTGGGDTSAIDTGASDTSVDAVPSDTGSADTGPADTGPADTGPADTGFDAGPCPGGETGSVACPFTSLGAISAVATGDYHFLFGSESFETRVDAAEGGGWMLVASADETVTSSGALTRTRTGPLTLQSHGILAPEIIDAIPDPGEVRINSSTGSVIVTSAFSRDSYVLGQLRNYQSLHRSVEDGEPGDLRWTGDTSRVSTTCGGSAPASLDGFIFQACGTASLHWAPRNSNNRWNRWHWGDGDSARDKLNLWVRD